jgi:peptidoglycan hydrolase CwlO-like protein
LTERTKIQLRKSKLEQALRIVISQINELTARKNDLEIQMHRIEGGIAELANLLEELEKEPAKPNEEPRRVIVDRPVQPIEAQRANN